MQDHKLDDEEGRLAALRRYEIHDTGGNQPFQRIVDMVCQVLDVPIAAVSLIDEDTLWLKASRGLDGGQNLRAGSFSDYTIQQADALMVGDTLDDGRFAGNPMITGAPYIRSYLGVPLTTPDGYNVGALCAVDCVPRTFDARQASIMQKLAEIVVEQFELQQIAKQDAMTGALTRRGFFAEVEKEFRRAARYERPSALVMIDVDHFKTINDRYGHPAGDAVLTSIASACMSTMRRSDVFGRLGGEEFGLLLTETEPEDALEAAERIRHMVEQTIVQVGGAEVRATISLGIAPMPAASEDVATWFAEADIALYEAKQFGRNRVVLGKARRPAPPPAVATHPAARPH